MADLVLRPEASSWGISCPGAGIAILATPPSGAPFPARPMEASLDDTSNEALLAELGGAKFSMAAGRWKMAGAVERKLYG